MIRKLLSSAVAGLALCSLASSAGAQAFCATPISPVPSFKWIQPYTPPRATFESRVQSCQNPVPFARIAMDDWMCTKQGPILRIDWWGWLSAPAQGQRPFYIAIYPDQNCQPAAAPLCRVCVTPDIVRLVARDCDPLVANPPAGGTHPIYFLSAALPVGLCTQFGTAANPQHLWLQISEADQESIRPGLEDFRWAGRRPIQVCPALQLPPLTQPLIDVCDGNIDDLSFRLYSRTVVGHLNVAVTAPVLTLRATLKDPAGNVVEQSNATVGSDGNFAINFDSPDGVYVLELDGMGLLRQRSTIQLLEGTEFRVNSFFDVFFGDLNQDGFINTADLTGILGNFGRSNP